MLDLPALLRFGKGMIKAKGYWSYNVEGFHSYHPVAVVNTWRVCQSLQYRIHEQMRGLSRISSSSAAVLNILPKSAEPVILLHPLETAHTQTKITYAKVGRVHVNEADGTQLTYVVQ